MIITETFMMGENKRKRMCQNMELKLCLQKKKKRIPKKCFKLNKKSAA